MHYDENANPNTQLRDARQSEAGIPRDIPENLTGYVAKINGISYELDLLITDVCARVVCLNEQHAPTGKTEACSLNILGEILLIMNRMGVMHDKMLKLTESLGV